MLRRTRELRVDAADDDDEVEVDAAGASEATPESFVESISMVDCSH